jgi:hypothetical protein
MKTAVDEDEYAKLTMDLLTAIMVAITRPRPRSRLPLNSKEFAEPWSGCCP